MLMAAALIAGTFVLGDWIGRRDERKRREINRRGGA
jgi:hypothetical protein